MTDGGQFLDFGLRQSGTITDPLQCQIRDTVSDFMAQHRRDTGRLVQGFRGIPPISPENIRSVTNVVLFLPKARPTKVTLFPNLFVEDDVPRVKCFHKVRLRGAGRQRTIIAEWKLFKALLQAEGFEQWAAEAYSEALEPLFKTPLLKLGLAIHKKVESFRNGPAYLKELERRKKAHFRAFHEKERKDLREQFRKLTQSRWTEKEILEVWRESECAAVMKS